MKNVRRSGVMPLISPMLGKYCTKDIFLLDLDFYLFYVGMSTFWGLKGECMYIGLMWSSSLLTETITNEFYDQVKFSK